MVTVPISDNGDRADAERATAPRLRLPCGTSRAFRSTNANNHRCPDIGAGGCSAFGHWGTRLAPGKDNCLVLDFAGNVSRHGPIDLVRPKRPGGGDGVAPTKVCPNCDSILPISVMECPDCGHVFESHAVKIVATASTLEILSSRRAQWVGVSDVSYRRHDKAGSRPSLRVDYRCGLIAHSEWICLEHSGYARRKAEDWWRRRIPELPVPRTIDEALALVSQLGRPSEILVRPNGRFTEVLNHRFAPCPSPMVGSVPSATARPTATAGSTPSSRSAIPAARPAVAGSAGVSARTSVTGGAA